MPGGQMSRILLWAVVWLQTAAAPPASDNCAERECIRSQIPSSSLPSSPSITASSSSSPPVVKPPQTSQDLLAQFTQVSESNSGERKHRDAGAVLPFIGLTNSADQSRSCCQNGGTCILGSFCACPRFFTGRSCEYDTRIRNCDFIPHGEWVQKGCSYCRCGYGMLHCFPHVFHKDCDDSEEEVRWYRSSAAGPIPAGSLPSLTLLLPLLSFL